MLNAFMLLVNLRLFGLYKYNVRQLWNVLANTPAHLIMYRIVGKFGKFAHLARIITYKFGKSQTIHQTFPSKLSC